MTRAALRPSRTDLHRCDDRDLLALVSREPIGSPERTAACEILVRRYGALVRSCVLRYASGPESTEELMQVGYVGLIKAINNFDPAVGASLAAYAQPCVSGEIKRHFRDKRWQIRVKRSASDLLAGARQADLYFRAASLDAPLAPDEGRARLADLVGQEDPGLELAMDMGAVAAHWSERPPRERTIRLMRFYGNMTQAQIGARLGLSQMHVSRLQAAALSYLRERLLGQDDDTTPRCAVSASLSQTGRQS
jgi:RNA polymerase sigma-B factor